MGYRCYALKYGISTENAGKIYLSAIIDLCDKRPVSYALSDHNNNAIVFKAFDAAVVAYPDKHPLIAICIIIRIRDRNES